MPVGHSVGAWPKFSIIGFLLLVTAIYLSVLMPAYWWMPVAVFVILAIALIRWRAMPFVAVAALIVGFYCAKEFGEWSLFGFRATFWYSCLYTLAVLVFGVRFLRIYWGKDRYMVVRTFFNMGAQLFIGFLIPYLLPFEWGGSAPDAQGKGVFLMYVWPLERNALVIAKQEGLTRVVKWFLGYNIVVGLVVLPVLVYYTGRRFYCSWLCGCGCLAETFGDPFRRLSPKGRISRKVEPVIYPFVLAGVGLTVWWLVAPESAHDALWRVDRWYGLVVMFVFSSLLGVGLYSLLGNRIWCRYFCPWAGLFGWLAKHGRYAIRTRGELCIGCGMCNTYCEMGIDIRGAAMRGQPVKTTTCVGCGMCIEKCPRRVLSFAVE
ncbi:MAG: 4Fe-4S binding protein [Armatimonadota bacterium]